jgi:hypothetical protein
MTYTELAALMQDQTFRGRIKVAALQYADSISIEESSTPAHNTRMRWAMNTMQQPDMVSQQLQPPVCMDPAVKSAGGDIDDVALQAAVEGVINRMM